MIQRKEPLSSEDFSKGLVTRSDILRPDPKQSPNCMDVKWYFDGAIGKRLGASTTNTIAIGSTSATGWTIDSGGTLTTSLQAYWKLDEVSGGRSDSYGNLTLQDVNSTGSIVGIRGNAGLFVATASNGLLVPTASAIETGNVNFSMSTWVYLNSTSLTVEQTLISKKDPEIPSNTVLLLHCDGTNGSTTFTDSSPSAKTVTAVGNAQITTAQSKFGGASALFDGNGDYLSVPSSTDFDFGTGDFTVDFWVRFNSLTQEQAPMITRNFGASGTFLVRMVGPTTLDLVLGPAQVDYQRTWAPALNTWYHVAIARNGTNLRLFIDGAQLGATQSDSTNITDSAQLQIGATATSVLYLDGWMDEIRISKGIARWTSNFTVPAKAYGVQEYEYWLYVNSNNNATFRVSSTGTNQTATVQASSFGALNTSTWYNVVAWHSNNSHIGISVNLSANTAGYTGGVKVGAAPFALGVLSNNGIAFPNTFANARIDETGFWKKILTTQERSDLYGGGTANTFTPGNSGFGWAMFDFGASNVRWLTVAAGTGIVASSNLGTTFVTISTNRTQNYQYFERSKNILIATSDAYDTPLYWAGSAGTFAAALAPNSAPAVKYSINYQGFLILLNSLARKRGFFYADENLQLTDPWTNSFDIPSSADDEITVSFILNKFLYLSTRYRLFRMAFVGGNPDWAFNKVKDWGFVPRTAKLMTIKGGQVVVGLDWQRRIRIFDGYDDVFASDNVENSNGVSEFAMKNVSYAGSGLIISNAEADLIEQEYRLNVAIGLQSSQTTHAIVLNGRNLSLYPYSNQNYQAMCIAESNNQQHLMAIDRSGFVHILNSGNLDVSKPVNEFYHSPPIFKTIPGTVSKAQNNNLYFKSDSCGQIFYQDALNRSTIMTPVRPLVNLRGDENVLQVEAALDIPATYNTYQFCVTSSSGTANPWKMSHWDFIQETKGMGKG